MEPKNQKTIYLIDGSSFLYRAYYGLRPLHTIDGTPVQAVYSFCRMIHRLSKKFDPKYLALVWDSKGKTTRHEIFEEYKATREAPPSDLFMQKELIQEFADLIGLAQIEEPGIEADDLMYSLAKDFSKKGYKIVLISSDKDFGQAISENVVLFDPFKDSFITREDFENKMGFPVEKLPFYFALLGDASDNIPGVRGIGKKGATTLVQQFDSLQDLYNNLDSVSKPKMRKALEENKENAFLSEKLFLFHYIPLEVSTKEFSFDPSEWKNAYPLFKKLEFKSLLKDLEKQGIKEEKKKLSEEKGYQFITVRTEEELDKVIKEIKEKKLCAIDTELSGLRPLKDRLVGISICCQKGIAYYIPFDHEIDEPQLNRDLVLKKLKPILEDPAIKKIMHHAKFDMLAFSHYGIEVKGLIFDTLVAAHLTTKDWQKVNLKYLSEYYLKEPMITFSEAVKQNGFKRFSQLPLDLATEYSASDAHQTFQLYPILKEELQNHSMEKLYEEIEFPLIFVLYEMEKAGIILDAQILKQLNERIERDLQRIKEQILALIGDEYKDINLSSPKQLKELLFDHLKLPPQKKGKTGYSTDQEVLEMLGKIHPVPNLIVKHRLLSKLKNTYVDALPKYINPETGKIHTTFSQTAVATGRLASSHPNLQNIPTYTPGYEDVSIRSAFKPEEGYIFLAPDYSQIELRVLAYLSQDPTLLQAFKEGKDIHTQTASKLFDVPLDEVTNAQRQLGKRINFSILYGLTPYGLSKDLQIPFKDAKAYIEKYFAQYPQVSEWMKEVIDETKEHGFVTTYWGRRRYIPGIYEKNRMLYDLAKRIAINTKAQGTAAEIMKRGMIELEKAFEEHNIDAQLLLQIHDELLISVKESEKEKAEKIVKSVLQNVAKEWNVPLEITTRFGKNWQEVTK